MSDFIRSRLNKILCVVALLVPSPGFCELTWDTRKIERIANPGDTEVVAAFRFANHGGAAIGIDAVRSACDCTTVELAKRSYAAGESGEIKAKFVIGDRVGIQEKDIYVTTNEAPEIPIILTLRVDIPELLSYSSRLLFWCTEEDLCEKSVVVASTGTRKILTLEASPDVQAVVLSRIENVEPGTKYRISIKPTSIDKPKSMMLDYVARFADSTVQRFKIYIVIRDVPGFQAR